MSPEIDHLVVRKDAAGACEVFLDVQQQPNLAWPAMPKVIEDTVVQARGSWSRVARKDFLCYNAHDYADRYAAADTMKINPDLRQARHDLHVRAGGREGRDGHGAVISNCPQINNPVNDYNPTPIRVVVTKPAGGSCSGCSLRC